MTSILQRAPIWRWTRTRKTARAAATAPAIGDADTEPPTLGAEAAATLHLPPDDVALLADRDLRTSSRWLAGALAEAMDAASVLR